MPNWDVSLVHSSSAIDMEARLLSPELTKQNNKPGRLYLHVVYRLCAQLLWSCPTSCDLMDHSPPDSSVHADSPGKNAGVGCHALLQGIFPTQGLNLRLLCLLH